MKKYKVIIIGAGPAGISAALTLKQKNINDILVIDKAKFPRYKCCAGYITYKTKLEYQKLGLEIENCHYSLIDDFKIYYKDKIKQTIKNKFLYTNRNIDRVELDYNFFQLLKKNHIKFLENIFITSLNQNNNTIQLSNGKQVAYEYLIFADGSTGFGSTLNKMKNKNIALQAIFKSNLKDGIEIHFGITKKGYAWISTKGGITNIGITDVFNEKLNYQEILLKFIQTKNIKISPNKIKGAFTPIGINKSIINNNIYFVGDAVGACDPLTLSGLRYSLASGKICAKSIKNNNPQLYLKYINTLKIKFKIMEIIQKIFYWKFIQFLVFNIACTIFKPLISFSFNHFFVNKK